MATNANAALTVFRHNDSATAYKVWSEPNADRLVDRLPYLERIHYLLVPAPTCMARHRIS